MSVLFSLKSVIFLSRLHGNVPTDVTVGGRSSLLHTVDGERASGDGQRDARLDGQMGGQRQRNRRADAPRWCFPSRHFHANGCNLKSSTEIDHFNQFKFFFFSFLNRCRPEV